MQNNVKVGVQVEDDPFPHPANTEHDLPLRLRQRGVHRAKQKWAGEANALEHLADDTTAEVSDVKLDVG
jgi:hypothetical protein